MERIAFRIKFGFIGLVRASVSHEEFKVYLEDD